jgi:hypothetical protein
MGPPVTLLIALSDARLKAERAFIAGAASLHLADVDFILRDLGILGLGIQDRAWMAIAAQVSAAPQRHHMLL